MNFQFTGEISASKSILNRLLVLQSYSKSLQVLGESRCDDVIRMRTALPKIIQAKGELAYCGAAGTTFRFLALRASRISGKHNLGGTAKLLARPQSTLVELIEQLGCHAHWAADGLTIEGNGWKNPNQALRVDRSLSSQFASAILLNAWDLDFPLQLDFLQSEGRILSEGYFSMTAALVQQAGMQIESTEKFVRIPAYAKIKTPAMRAEPDLSSAFAVAALGAIGGSATIKNFPKDSLQPDSIFPQVLKSMGTFVEYQEDRLTVSRVGRLSGVNVDLGDSPDLFPVLAVLCAFAGSPSKLFGATHLVHKESNRIESTAKLLRHFGAKFAINSDGMEIAGNCDAKVAPFSFDPMDDHRLAMAGAVAKMAGVPIEILHPQVVEKSFPEFWDVYRDGGGVI